jgi:hypothetical protein
LIDPKDDSRSGADGGGEGKNFVAPEYFESMKNQVRAAVITAVVEFKAGQQKHH